MCVFGACILIGILAMLYLLATSNYNNSIEDYFAGILFGGLLGALVGVIMTGIITSFSPKVTTYEAYSFEIVSLSDKTCISGAFILGTGSVNNTFSYVFYRKDSYATSTAYSMGWVGIVDTSIVEDAVGNTGSVDVVKKTVSSKWWWATLPFLSTCDTKYYIHVPPNTILKAFQLNREG